MRIIAGSATMPAVKGMAAGLFMMMLLVGCGGKDAIPSGIIPRLEMEKILWDLVQADQYAAQYLVADSAQVYKKDSTRIDMKTETLKLYEQVFRLHQVSRDDFRKSFQYYQRRPDLARGMLDSLVARGNKLRMESYKMPNSTPAPVTPPPMPAIHPAGFSVGTAPAPGAHGVPATGTRGVPPGGMMHPTTGAHGVPPAGMMHPVTGPHIIPAPGTPGVTTPGAMMHPRATGIRKPLIGNPRDSVKRSGPR